MAYKVKLNYCSRPESKWNIAIWGNTCINGSYEHACFQYVSLILDFLLRTSNIGASKPTLVVAVLVRSNIARHSIKKTKVVATYKKIGPSV